MLSNGFTKRTAGVGVALAALGGAAFVAIGTADSGHGPNVTHVPTANERARGYAPAPKLSPELQQVVWAQGSTKLENPVGINSFYGYQNDVPATDNPDFPQMVPGTAQGPAGTEAQKTEPDKNTYLEFKRGLHGGDSHYDYGTHFLYQGHEVAVRDGATDPALGLRKSYITRINLDADAEHRVTLLATTDTQGRPIRQIDGSTWDPFAERLIFTTESSNAPTYASTPDLGPGGQAQVEDVSGALGRGGYEGVQNDSDGNVWLVEDIGGGNKAGTTAARRPNSFVYRYVPQHPGDLHNGKLQVLQVLNKSGQPITQATQEPVNAPDQKLIHSYGNQLDTRWITIHDTADSNASFDANAAAKTKDGTPFKRPENGNFRPGTGFREFYFTETGDTNRNSEENGNQDTGEGGAGGWGGIQKLIQRSPSSDTGKLTLFYRGNEKHTGLDGLTVLSKDKVTSIEDAGETLHQQRQDDTHASPPHAEGAFDSGWVLDFNTDYSKPSNQPTRWLAAGRDASATLDQANGGFGKNDQDNEITGVYVADGDPGRGGVLGAKLPNLFHDGWRWFYTQQHGDNVTYEVIPSPRFSNQKDDDDHEHGRGAH